jgi:hypothetical protein
MKSRTWSAFALTLFCLASLHVSQACAQSPSVLYTWAGTGNVAQWTQAFGTNTVTLANTNPGDLTVTETGAAGTTVAISDDFNRVRETPSGPSGGLDLTGLSSLQFDLAQSGSSPINVQFYTQASTSSSFVSLGPDVAVAGGGVVNTYTVPLTGLTPTQIVYLRTIGMNIRDHAALGNVTWTVKEVRSAGTPLTNRVLESFDNGTVEGGLQGALVNFGNAGVAGNDGGQNQTGLSHNATGSGSLQWTSPAGGSGGAISVGNGTALSGNTFNNRVADLSNYVSMHVRMSATETTTSQGGSEFVQPFFQTNNFGSFQSLTGQNLPIDGQFHDLIFTMPGSLTNMNVVDQTGLNLGTHTNELVFNVDLIEFSGVPEPTSALLLGIGMIGGLGAMRRTGRSGPVG